MMYIHDREENIFEGLFQAEKPSDADTLGDAITESAVNSAIGDLVDKQARASAMSALLTWLDEGDYTYEALDSLAAGVADVDFDDEVGEDEEDYYNDILDAIGGAMVFLGAESDNVTDFLDDEDDDAGEKLGEFLAGKIESDSRDEDEIIGDFAVRESLVAESTIRVVRRGKVVRKKKRIRKPKRRSASQRAALRKARRKAHTGPAKLARRKSLKIRRRRGL